METAAVYWEPKIKTYGLWEAVNLSLLELTIKAEQTAKWGHHINKLDNMGINFDLALIQYLNNQRLLICLLYQRKWETKIQNHIHQKLQADIGESVQIKSPVELIYFHGPHFGDRNGIANSAFRVLTDENVPILVAGCSGSAIYLVLPENTIRKAKLLLGSVFDVPQVASVSNNSK